MGLVPGVSLAQWITARLAARGLTFASRLFMGIRGSRERDDETERVRGMRGGPYSVGGGGPAELSSLSVDFEQGPTVDRTFTDEHANSVGLEGLPRR